MSADEKQLGKLSESQQQELCVLEKHAQIVRDELQELAHREQKVKLARMEQYSQLKKLEPRDRANQMNEIQRTEKQQFRALQDRKNPLQQHLKCYEFLRDQVQNNVPHEKRRLVPPKTQQLYPLKIHDDMAIFGTCRCRN